MVWAHRIFYHLLPFVSPHCRVANEIGTAALWVVLLSDHFITCIYVIMCRFVQLLCYRLLPIDINSVIGQQQTAVEVKEDHDSCCVTLAGVRRCSFSGRVRGISGSFYSPACAHSVLLLYSDDCPLLHKCCCRRHRCFNYISTGILHGVLLIPELERFSAVEPGTPRHFLLLVYPLGAVHCHGRYSLHACNNHRSSCWSSGSPRKLEHHPSNSSHSCCLYIWNPEGYNQCLAILENE